MDNFINNKLLPLDPISGKVVPIRNVEKEIKARYANRPLDDATKAFQVAFEERRKVKASSTIDGYGAFYDESYKNSFVYGSNLASAIVFPARSGINAELNLACTNRTAKGCEVLIRYKGGNNPPELSVYDWGKTRPDFVLNLPYEDLADYIFPIVVDPSGMSLPCIFFGSATEYVDSVTWRNIVTLSNQSTSTWDVIYQAEYPSTVAEQKDDYLGSWAAIIEPLQNSYSGLGFLGFSSIVLQTSSSIGTWTGWNSLLDSESVFLTGPPNKILPYFFVPNSQFIFRSPLLF
ncbi:MAG: hypothetical protein LBT59_20540 [Clostridiales bacterium]|jgi:hypothetical protein|nr:hypothetical protein [Clostridiales bacterium]